MEFGERSSHTGKEVCGIEKFESERERILHLIGYVHLF